MTEQKITEEVFESREGIDASHADTVEEIEEGEVKILGRFKKSTLIKAGIGAVVLAGGLYLISKAKEYDNVIEVVENVEEVVGE